MRCKPGRSSAPSAPTETTDVGIPTGIDVPPCIINAVFKEEEQGFVFPSPEASERDDQQIYRAGFTKPSTGLSIVPCQLEKNKLHRCRKNLSENLLFVAVANLVCRRNYQEKVLTPYFMAELQQPS